MKNEHGSDTFADGCPVCLELCCCGNKTVYCNRKNHCYRKCPASKSTDSVAKANVPMWDYRGDAFSGMIKNPNGKVFPVGTSRGLIIRSDGLGESFGSVGSDASGFHYLPINTSCLSKNGSLDFLAAAVSIMDGTDNGHCHHSNSDNHINHSNPHSDYHVHHSHSHADHHYHGTDTDNRADAVNKRIRDGDATQLRTDTQNGSNLSEINSVNTMENFSGKFHEIENKYSEVNEKNKSKRTEASFNESSAKQPAPSYFLASNLLPSSSKRIVSQNSPLRSVDNSFPVENKEKWLEIEKNIENKSVKKCKTRDLEIYIQNPSEEAIADRNQNSQFISSNSSPLHRMGRQFYQSSISYDSKMIQSDEECPLNTVYSSISSHLVPSQIVRNVADEDSVTRDLILGLNRNKLQPQSIFPSKMTNIQKNSLALAFNHPPSSPVFFSPVGNLSSQLLPPPL